MAVTDAPGLWSCRSCGADNTPEHCNGEADQDRFDREFPRCEPGVVCICGCDDCSPSVCRVCGDDL